MSKSAWNYFDPLSMVVIVLTLVLFVIALFVTGFTHDLLQECGVFLVSVKLIVMSHKNGVSARLFGRAIGEDPESAGNFSAAKRMKCLAPRSDFHRNLRSRLRDGMLHFLACPNLRSELHAR